MADSFPAALQPTEPAHVNLTPARLIELALQREEATLAASGAIVTCTHPHTGRAARDKYAVVAPTVKDQVWWGDVNQPMPPDVFGRIAERVRRHLEQRPLFVFDGSVCADPRHRFGVRVCTERAWHALFAACLFRHDLSGSATPAQSQLTMWHAPTLRLDPAKDGTRSDSAIILDLARNWIVIAGTHYAGEVKKSVFSLLNYALPQRGVFPMHCSATRGDGGDTALLFGLSGTGKTTLSADPERQLIGDDEHGWSEHGVFNFEGGCYAKVIRLSRQAEPQIFDAIRFGSILENVVLNPATRQPDYNDATITENSRAAYPLEYIHNLDPSGQGPHPRHVLFLTCDAFGVLPPLSRLTREQALYHFLSGYTAKIAGTEAGIRDPQATFSSCFAAPFLTLPPMRYAELLGARLDRHGSTVWLVNTGWTGGPYGEGQRIPLNVTRRLVRAALQGELADVDYAPDPIFGVLVPRSCPGVAPDLLRPRSTWKSGEAYDRQAAKLAALFQRNFEEHFSQAPAAVRGAGPRTSA